MSAGRRALFLDAGAARADTHAMRCFGKSHQGDLLNEVRSTFSRQADILMTVHPGLRGKLKGFENPHLLSARALGARTFPRETYFFLADFAPRDAMQLAQELKTRGILIKPPGDPRLGPGYLRVTTALPEDNTRFVDTLKELL